MHSVGQQIRKLRKVQKLNINQLGKSVGVSGSYIAKLETGERRFSLDLLSKIAEQLGTPVSNLLGSSENGQNRIPVYRSRNLSDGLGHGASNGAERDKAEFHVELPHLKSKNTFGLIADHGAYKPCSYKAGDILLFSSGSEAQPGDVVLLRAGNNEFKVGEFPANGNGHAVSVSNAHDMPAARLVGTITQW